MIDNFDQIPLSDFPYYPGAYEGMSMENSVDDPYNPGFQVRECECQEYNEYQGLCKICGGSGVIYTSKKTGLEYDQPYEQQRFLVPVKAHMLSGKERKYGQNWAKSLHMCPRCCEAVPIGFRFGLVGWRHTAKNVISSGTSMEITCFGWPMGISSESLTDRSEMAPPLSRGWMIS